MITTATEYEKAQSELRDLQDRLDKLQDEYPIGEKGFTKAGIRKLIARVNEELAILYCPSSSRVWKRVLEFSDSRKGIARCLHVRF